MNRSSKIILGMGLIAGAAGAVYASSKRNPSPSSSTAIPNGNATPVRSAASLGSDWVEPKNVAMPIEAARGMINTWKLPCSTSALQSAATRYNIPSGLLAYVMGYNKRRYGATSMRGLFGLNRQYYPSDDPDAMIENACRALSQARRLCKSNDYATIVTTYLRPASASDRVAVGKYNSPANQKLYAAVAG